FSTKSFSCCAFNCFCSASSFSRCSFSMTDSFKGESAKESTFSCDSDTVSKGVAALFWTVEVSFPKTTKPMIITKNNNTAPMIFPFLFNLPGSIRFHLHFLKISLFICITKYYKNYDNVPGTILKRKKQEKY